MGKSLLVSLLRLLIPTVKVIGRASVIMFTVISLSPGETLVAPFNINLVLICESYAL